jgi:hypothetical protein
MKRRPGHPVGSKNKPKVSAAAPGPSAAPRDASPPPPPKIYSFLCIADAQCREIKRVPLKFTKFMDGRELHEAILCEQSGAPIKVSYPKKNTNVQRVCVDYTSLNKHCPKDPFPLPGIDQIIDSTAGCARLSFLDAYSGYNEIKLKKEDEEK